MEHIERSAHHCDIAAELYEVLAKEAQPPKGAPFGGIDPQIAGEWCSSARRQRDQAERMRALAARLAP